MREVMMRSCVRFMKKIFTFSTTALQALILLFVHRASSSNQDSQHVYLEIIKKSCRQEPRWLIFRFIKTELNIHRCIHTHTHTHTHTQKKKNSPVLSLPSTQSFFFISLYPLYRHCDYLQWTTLECVITHTQTHTHAYTNTHKISMSRSKKPFYSNSSNF